MRISDWSSDVCSSDLIWFANPAGDEAPIMVKFLFTSERLSIQVHPDDEAARGAGFPRGKEECWLILDAQPGAELGVSLNRQSSREELHAAALDGSIVDMIDWRPSHTDDFVYKDRKSTRLNSSH